MHTSLSGDHAMELIFDGSRCTATGCCGASYAATCSSRSPTVYTRTFARRKLDQSSVKLTYLASSCNSQPKKKE